MASEEEIAQQSVEPFTSVGQVIILLITTLLVMFLVYGIYIIIFGLCINILWHCHESPTSQAYTTWIIALFILTTIYNASNIWISMDQTLIALNAIKTKNYIPFLESLMGSSTSSALGGQLGLQAFSSVILSCIFDYLMVQRCYIIWGYNRRILYPFAFVVGVTDTIGFVVAAHLTGAFNNFSCICLSIDSTDSWSSLVMVHQVGQITGSRLYTKYKIFVTTILESGLLFSGTQVVGIIVQLVTDPGSNGLIPFDFGVISVQMAGIAPTVIIVRIAYGQAVESVQQMVSTLQFAEGADHSQQQSTAAYGTIDLQQSLVAVRERGTVGKIKMDQEKPPSEMAENVV
ncbi:hypothetical protein PM082_004460 [Marasmius tenuissimus]|nr:hypothetical protein PM082_004460 [Marasmius tenuissimus]